MKIPKKLQKQRSLRFGSNFPQGKRTSYEDHFLVGRVRPFHVIASAATRDAIFYLIGLGVILPVNPIVKPWVWAPWKIGLNQIAGWPVTIMAILLRQLIDLFSGKIEGDALYARISHVDSTHAA